MPPMTGAERVRKHRARLYREREAQIRSTWTPSKLSPVDHARLRDWLTRASAADLSAFLGREVCNRLAPLRPDVTTGAAKQHRSEASKRPRKRATRLTRLFIPGLETLGLELWADLTDMEVNAAFREAAKTAHPDQGGSNGEMQRLNRAKEIAMTFVRVARGEQIPLEELHKLFGVRPPRAA